MEVGDCSDNRVVVAFTNDLKDKDLLESLYLNPPKYFECIIDRANNHTIMDEALKSIDDETPQPYCNKKMKTRKGE